MIWHDVENGAYAADLPLWRELAREADGPVLDLGAGTGRVALDLAAARPRASHALDSDARPARRARAARRRGAACRVDCLPGRRPRARPRRSASRSPSPRCSSCRSSAALSARAELLARRRRAPARRAALRRRARRPVEAVRGRGRLPPLPTWSSATAGSSRAARSTCAAEPGGVAVERLRQAVSPDGELTRSCHTQRSTRAARTSSSARRATPGLRPAARHAVPETADLHRQHGGGMPALRVCSLYPELMNIYADRGNIAVLRARCEWRGHRLRARSGDPGRAARPGRPRPLLHGRRPGPRPGGRGRATWPTPSATPCTPRRTAAPWCSPSAAATSCSATPTSSAARELPGRRPRRPAHRARAGPAADRQLRDRGRPGHGPRVIAGFENHGGRTYLGAGRAPARPRAGRARQQRARRLRGRAARQRDRHLPARAAAAEERLAGRPPDRAGARDRAGAAARRRRSCEDARARSRRAARPGWLGPRPAEPSRPRAAPRRPRSRRARTFSKPSSRSVRMPSARAASRDARRRRPFSRISAAHLLGHAHHLVDRRCARGSRCRRSARSRSARRP